MTELGQAPAGPAPARDRVPQRVRRAGGRGRPRSPHPWPSCRRRCVPLSGRSTQVQQFAPVLRSSLESLRKPIRKLPATNEAVIPFLEQTEPVIRTQIRPFVRAARPWTDDLRLAAEGTAKAMPDLRRSFGELNRFFNIGAYNPGGAEGLDGKSISQQRQRQEGFLYWLAWVSQNGSSLFSSADGQGPWRRVTICGVPAAAVTGDRERRARRHRSEQPRAGRSAQRDHEPRREQRRRPAARHPVRLLQLQRPALDAASGQRRRWPDPAASLDPATPAMNKNPPSLGRMAAMVGFTLSVAALLMFLWTAFGGTLPAAPGGLSLQGGLPGGLGAREGGGRAHGRREHRQGQEQGARQGRAHDRRRDGDRRAASRRSAATRARSCARRASSARPTWRSRPAARAGEKLDDGGTLAQRERGRHGRARRGLPRVRPEDARRLPAVAARGRAS